MSEQETKYSEFVKFLEETYPKMYSNCYCGISIGDGWFDIIKALSAAINGHVEWTNQQRERLLKENPYHDKIPEAVPEVEVHQIKEKFGGLRFYYQGGDKYIRGLVNMAEAWASKTCETCGNKGEIRHGGWMRTLCDKHEAEYQTKRNQVNGVFDNEISEETGND